MSIETPAVRNPAVAGRFYPGDADALRAEVARLCPANPNPARAKVVIGPHAGLMYSGSILGETYAAVDVPRRVILLGPNHTGQGVARALANHDVWRFPFGDLTLDREMLRRLAEQGVGEPDARAHALEHALEVHVPFLVHRQAKLLLAPICLRAMRLDACRELGEALAAVIAATEEPVLLAVSSDMHHFADAQTGARLDEMALARVQALDPAGLYGTVRDHGISMCGVIPATVALFAALCMGAQTARLIRYGHSGEFSGDHSRVVGYAGLLIA